MDQQGQSRAKRRARERERERERTRFLRNDASETARLSHTSLRASVLFSHMPARAVPVVAPIRLVFPQFCLRIAPCQAATFFLRARTRGLAGWLPH